MTALTEAVSAAQGRALAALERAYLRDLIDSEAFAVQCDAIGARDVLERADLLACLDVLREYGATEPPAPTNRQAPRPVSEAQRKLVARLADDRGVSAPELAGLTMAKASELIEQLKRGTYNADDWEVPF